jgi:hypothetical protein
LGQKTDDSKISCRGSRLIMLAACLKKIKK